jgi:hypothetical protein
MPRARRIRSLSLISDIHSNTFTTPVAATGVTQAPHPLLFGHEISHFCRKKAVTLAQDQGRRGTSCLVATKNFDLKIASANFFDHVQFVHQDRLKYKRETGHEPYFVRQKCKFFKQISQNCRSLP